MYKLKMGKQKGFLLQKRHALSLCIKVTYLPISSCTVILRRDLAILKQTALP